MGGPLHFIVSPSSLDLVLGDYRELGTWRLEPLFMFSFKLSFKPSFKLFCMAKIFILLLLSRFHIMLEIFLICFFMQDDEKWLLSLIQSMLRKLFMRYL